MGVKPSVVSSRFYGYVTDIKVRILSNDLVYHIVLSDLSGNEIIIRMRVPPNWLRIGIPITGELVKVIAERETYFTLREPRIYSGLKTPRVYKVSKVHVEKPKNVGKGILYAESEGREISFPILSDSVLEKAKKAVIEGEYFLYVADLPMGSMIVSIQSSGQKKRYDKIATFLNWMRESERIK